MTKQQKTESAIVHVTTDMLGDDQVLMALYEQLYLMIGATSVASLLADRLRDPEPQPAILRMVARWLDPRSDDRFELVLKRRRNNQSWTKRVNNQVIVKAVKKCQQALGNKHGDQKKAVAKVAKQFEVSKATVLKALRSK
jgi:hypothetical protein